MSQFPISAPKPMLEFQVDGNTVRAAEGSTILDVLRRKGIDTPTLCYLETLTPVNACRVCVVEVEGSRTLVPSCARKVEAGMAIKTNSERVRHSRKLVFELLASSVDMSLANADFRRWMAEYEAKPEKFGKQGSATGAGDRDSRTPGHHHAPNVDIAETVTHPVKIDNALYVRDYSRCILCYKCVEACGEDAQNTFAIAASGRGFDIRISTEFDIPLTESACVYCGNCIAVCPTGALMTKTEFDMREANTWNESEQTVTQTICPYCGVGCNLELHVQDDRIVKATSPQDHSITHGNLCIKGRFGWEYVNNRES